MCKDHGALRMHPLIAVPMIEVPVRVDEMFDRARVHFSQSVGDPGARGCITRIDHQFSIRSAEDGDVSAWADQCIHVAAQGLDGDVSGFRTFARRKHDVLTLGEEMPSR